MNGEKTVKLIGSIFAVIGSLLLLGSLYLLFISGHPDAAFIAIITGVIGVVFACIGFGIVVHGIHKRKNQELLMSSGLRISAQLIEIIHCTNFEVNGRSPYKIICFSKNSTGLDHVFESSNIWINPEPFMSEDERIKVYVMPDDYKKYYVDLSFIPEKYRS